MAQSDGCPLTAKEFAVRIENIHIQEKYRNHGLGTHLLMWLLTKCKDRPFVASIIEGSQSQNFFERLKFKEGAKLGFQIVFVKPA
ncbi:GNAT family N-acetyltransferase [Bradyrhizobium neotropicale]|uniref:GNAT family N-acetyltransferase n=1 Tax=Bradyrhizobium neotropicale TaxID=1497615 RepID=UPI001AD6FED4|nr:GNAT family N-acetyltransferase [Bradyrhizobium neotropicale]